MEVVKGSHDLHHVKHRSEYNHHHDQSQSDSEEHHHHASTKSSRQKLVKTAGHQEDDVTIIFPESTTTTRIADKMFFLLKLLVSLSLFIFGIQVVLAATIITTTAQGRSLKHAQYDNELDGDSKGPFQPDVGLYLKNYAGKVVTTVGSISGSAAASADHLILTVPRLKVEDHIWEGKSITLECWSEKYPVYWEYRGLGAPTVRVTTERKAPSFQNVSSYKFGAIVTFSSTEYKQTGEYSCKDLGGMGGSVSLYLLVPGKNIFVLSNEGSEEQNKSVSVTADEDNSWVTVPCNPWGDYVCIGKVNNGKVSKEEKLRIRVKGPNSTVNRFSLGGVGNGQSTSTSGSTVSISYNPTARRIECCSSMTTISRTRRSRGKRAVSLPRMRLSPCASISDCYFSSTHLASGSAFCSKRTSGECESDSFIKRLNETCVAYELPEIHEAGVLDCSLDGAGLEDGKAKDLMEAQMQFSYEPELGFVTKFDPEETETREILGIGREQEGSTAGSIATYFCRANSFFFSDGIKWAVERRGATNTLDFLTQEDARPTIKVDEAKVSRVYCFAPIWDSATDWRNVSMTAPLPT
ncbi:hypothetical protein Fcan01_14208 [Folsomia candida]|uniref:Ig-like domain-containing protein n=1 Tax=Folsomia candida TaxID=158441 RepID=A0A226DZ71_FOLCA|nr:hypothetical protein Fcan01_14208 [Folsomia candida]